MNKPCRKCQVIDSLLIGGLLGLLAVIIAPVSYETRKITACSSAAVLLLGLGLNKKHPHHQP